MILVQITKVFFSKSFAVSWVAISLKSEDSCCNLFLTNRAVKNLREPGRQTYCAKKNKKTFICVTVAVPIICVWPPSGAQPSVTLPENSAWYAAHEQRRHCASVRKMRWAAADRRCSSPWTTLLFILCYCSLWIMMTCSCDSYHNPGE